MTLLKLKPRSTSSLPAGINSLIDELLRTDPNDATDESTFVPRANILERENEFEIHIELAGFNKKNIEINIEKDVLTVKGANSPGDHNTNNSFKYHVHQIRYGKFQRSFYLPDDLSPDKINARFENGILYILIPKDESKLLKRTINIG